MLGKMRNIRGGGHPGSGPIADDEPLTAMIASLKGNGRRPLHETGMWRGAMAGHQDRASQCTGQLRLGIPRQLPHGGLVVSADAVTIPRGGDNRARVDASGKCDCMCSD